MIVVLESGLVLGPESTGVTGSSLSPQAVNTRAEMHNKLITLLLIDIGLFLLAKGFNIQEGKRDNQILIQILT